MVEKKLYDLREQKNLLGLIQLLNKYRLKLDKTMSSKKLLVYKAREYSELYTAVLDDDIDALREVLKGEKSNIDEVYHDTYTALITASFHGQDEIVKLLLDAGATVDKTVGEYHKNALSYAIYEGHLSTVKLLLDAGANIESRTGLYQDYTPLILAARGKNATIVNYLLKQGADTKVTNIDGLNPLMLAILEPVKKDNEKIIHLLLPKSDVNQKTKPYNGMISSALICAWYRTKDEKIIDALLDAGATAGENAIEKHSFAKAFMIYTSNYKNQKTLYKYSKFAISQLKDTKDLTVEDDLIYLYAGLYELAIITGNTLSKEELSAFVRLSKKYPKAKAYLEMFYIVEESKNPNVLPMTLAKSTKEWQKNYAHLIKNRWSFSALKQWANRLDSSINTGVTDVLTMLDDAVNR